MQKISSSIVIHQPHFCAWIPYYCRIASTETFVILDDVPFRRHYYHDRTYLADLKRNAFQINIPTNGTQNVPINQVETINSKYFFSKFLKTIFLNYKKYPFFDEIYEPLALKSKFLEKEILLLNININFLMFFLDLLNIQYPTFKYSSQISTSNDRNERIIEICLSESKRKILCGWGASKDVHNTSLIGSYEFEFVQITQSEFQSINKELQLLNGISIIDTLMNLGKKITRIVFEECTNLYKIKLGEQNY
jgi:hypothetical protein